MTRAEPPVPHHDWLDDAAGPVVRPYTMTQGRVRPAAGGFDLVAFVVAVVAANEAREQSQRQLQPEHRMIIELAQEPLSVAELSAHLDLALGVIRVLLGDLLSAGLIEMHEPPAEQFPDDNILKAVVNGLRAL